MKAVLQVMLLHCEFTLFTLVILAVQILLVLNTRKEMKIGKWALEFVFHLSVPFASNVFDTVNKGSYRARLVLLLLLQKPLWKEQCTDV